jgi:hypothetical protein
MIVDNMLGRCAPSPDNSPANDPAFREALLGGWQRLEAALERNYENEHISVIHIHWAVCAAVLPSPRSDILLLISF